jgi:hypothetical protein
MESCADAAAKRSYRINEKLSENDLGSPFDPINGDLMARPHLFSRMVEAAVENAARRIGRNGRPTAESVSVGENLVSIKAPQVLMTILPGIGRTVSPDIRTFAGEDGRYVVSTWTRDGDPKDEGMLHPYAVGEATHESKIFVFNDGGRKHEYRCSSLSEARRMFDTEVPVAERLGEPSLEVKTEKVRDTGKWSVMLDLSETAKKLGVPEKHKLAIAKKTLKMTDAAADIMGGMSKEEAREFLRSIGWTERQIAKLDEGTLESRILTVEDFGRAFSKMVETLASGRSCWMADKDGNAIAWCHGDSFAKTETADIRLTGKAVREAIGRGRRFVLSVEGRAGVSDQSAVGVIGETDGNPEIGSRICFDRDGRSFCAEVVDSGAAFIVIETSESSRLHPDVISQASAFKFA